MASPHLQLKPQECSEIGLLVLKHISNHQLTFSSMASSLGISRAALRSFCLGKNNPGRSTISQLSDVLNISEEELCQITIKHRLRKIYENDEQSLILTFKAVQSIVEILIKRVDLIAEKSGTQSTKIKYYELYNHALKLVLEITP